VCVSFFTPFPQTAVQEVGNVSFRCGLQDLLNLQCLQRTGTYFCSCFYFYSSSARWLTACASLVVGRRPRVRTLRRKLPQMALRQRNSLGSSNYGHLLCRRLQLHRLPGCHP
jgi:hypothetical protein